jgi:hypothetical protein
MKVLSETSRRPGRDSNQARPECKAGALLGVWAGFLSRFVFLLLSSLHQEARTTFHSTRLSTLPYPRV